MSLASEPMSRVDTAWLRMDTPENLMMIVGVWFLRPRITVAQLRARCEEKLLPYPRFRQRVVEDAMGAQWVEDREFSLDNHVVASELRRREGQPLKEALQEHVSQLASEPLDTHHPLWQMELIDDVEGQSALVCRIHHCIGDGIALMTVMLSIADGGALPPARKPNAEPEGEHDWIYDHLTKPITDLTVKAVHFTGKGMAKGMDTFMTPDHPLEGPLAIANMGMQAVRDLSAFALMPDDAHTRLKGKPGVNKTVAWADGLQLDEVKAVGKALGGSVNDVLLSCVAGAIGAYLRAKGDDPSGQEIRAMVPVNLRPLEKAWQLGNKFGLVPLVLPIGLANPVERLYAVRERMHELKGSFQPLMAFGVLAVAGLLIRPVQNTLLGLFAKKATAVMTNVPGPAEPLKFCGSTVENVMFWVPQNGDIGMGVSILTYAGKVQFGLITDAKLCPDPEAIIAQFAPEFEKLLLLTLMLPWNGQIEA